MITVNFNNLSKKWYDLIESFNITIKNSFKRENKIVMRGNLFIASPIIPKSLNEKCDFNHQYERFQSLIEELYIYKDDTLKKFLLEDFKGIFSIKDTNTKENLLQYFYKKSFHVIIKQENRINFIETKKTREEISFILLIIFRIKYFHVLILHNKLSKKEVNNSIIKANILKGVLLKYLKNSIILPINYKPRIELYIDFLICNNFSEYIGNEVPVIKDNKEFNRFFRQNYIKQNDSLIQSLFAIILNRKTVTLRNPIKSRNYPLIFNNTLEDLTRASQKNIKNARFDEMRKIKPYILKEYNIFKEIAQSEFIAIKKELIEDNIFSLFDTKMRKEIMLDGKDGNLSIRNSFVKIITEYIHNIKGETIEEINQNLIIKIGFISEVIIIIQYLDNQILDNKSIKNKNDIASNLISAAILRGVLTKYIQGTINSKYQFIVKKYVDAILFSVDVGQRIDKELNNFYSYKTTKWEVKEYKRKSEIVSLTNHIEVINELIIKTNQVHFNGDKSNLKYLDLYFRRILLTNTTLFSLITEMLCEIFNLSSKKRDDLISFSVAYGLALQVVNDNCDFVPSSRNENTTGRKSSDTMSDLKNKNITLPLIFHLKDEKNDLINEVLEKKDKKIDKDKEEEVFKSIKKGKWNSAIGKSIILGKEIGNIAKSYIKYNNNAGMFLKNMCDISIKNRFYNHFEFSKQKPNI